MASRTFAIKQPPTIQWRDINFPLACICNYLEKKKQQKKNREADILIVHLVHTFAKQVILHCGKNENKCKMYKNEKCTCKACKSVVFHRQICKFVMFFSLLLSWFFKLPNSESHPLSLTQCKYLASAVFCVVYLNFNLTLFVAYCWLIVSLKWLQLSLVSHFFCILAMVKPQHLLHSLSSLILTVLSLALRQGWVGQKQKK